MKAFSVVLVSLLFCANCLVVPRPLLDKELSENGSEALAPNDEASQETAEASIVAPELVDPPAEECSNMTLGVNVQILEGTNVQNRTTSNAFECCELCQEANGCTSWIHNRENGWCALYNVTRTNVTRSPESELDVGGFTIMDELTPKSPAPGKTSSLVTTSSGSSASPGPFGFLGFPSLGLSDEFPTPASLDRFSALRVGLTSLVPIGVPVPYCRIHQGVIYPNGNVLVAGRAGSAKFCCNLCRLSSNCNSWFYNSRNGKCTMNRDIPASASRDSSRFDGGTALG